MSLKKIQAIVIFLIGAVSGIVAVSYYPNLSLTTYDLGSRPSPMANVSRVNKPSDVDMGLFWRVWDEVEKSFLFKDKIDHKKMIEGAIKGMVASLGDPYTSFLPAKANKESKADLRGQFEGVGMQLGYIDEKLAVIAPLDDTPADRAGVKAGDFILAINDEESLKMSLPEAVEKIRGPKGTKVKLSLLRAGQPQPITVEIIRDTITVPSVKVKFVKVDGKVYAHLKLMRFGDLTESQWRQAVDKILFKQNEEGGRFEGIILDLRNNPGGYLNGAVFVASEFLDRGVVVVEEGLSGTRKSLRVNRQGRLINQPLVVLVNKGSASASEIVAGALRDRKRAVIVGMTTFGKGTVQQAKDVDGGAGLHITVAKWLTPDGEWVHKKGIEPQVKAFKSVEEMMKLNYDQMDEAFVNKAVEVLSKYDYYMNKFYESNPR
ncbi:MAG: PDZ domain-containing protein [bacterium]|nr:PDZ domain-containing protein [bacterium]